MQKSERVNFGSKIGAILAAAGSAVGLGNIWRFPYETGNHGGAAFILIYLACVLVLGMPIMMAEFTVGRHSKASTGKAYSVLAPGTHWKWLGYLGVLAGLGSAAGFLILGYYSVVAGWTLEYILEAGANEFANKRPDDFILAFEAFSQDPVRPLIWLVVFLLLTHFVIVKGVKDGIEKSSKILMPVLFILIILLAVCSLSLPNAEKGLEFLLKPDFSKVTGDVFLGAMGQAFFSLSLGMGCLSTYASYFGKETKLGNTALSVGVIDTFVALAGVICSKRDFVDPYNESERQITYAIHEDADRLMAFHCQLWNELWQGDIRIEGDDDAQRAVRFALFNLYSFGREGTGLSISPMGLSSQGDNGHIFWDTELWMYPPILLLNQGIAESMVNYRTNRLAAACKRAITHGYRGAMFPWESDDAGEESTPTFALTGPLEHHITADIVPLVAYLI